MPKLLEREKVVQVPVIWREAAIQPESFDVENLTVEVRWTAGAEARRWRWAGWDIEEFEESLSFEDGAVRLDRLQSGRMAVLDNHNSYTGLHGDKRYGQVGVVLGGSIDSKAEEGTARIQFSRRASLEELRQDVKDGVITSFSFGYRVYQYRDITEKDDPVRRLRAIDWEPFELSPVSVPADVDAHLRTRAEEMTPQTNRCMVLRSTGEEQGNSTGERAMPPDDEVVDPTKQRSAEPQKPKETAQPPVEPTRSEPAPAPAADPAPDLRALLKEVRGLCGKAGLPETFALRLLEQEGMTLERAKDGIFEELSRQQQERSRVDGNRITGGAEPRDKVRAGVIEALEVRTRHRPVGELTELGRGFHGVHLCRMAEEYLRACGVTDLPRNNWELAKRAFHHTSDFPLLLEAVANKSLLKGYREVPQTFLPLSTPAEASDFKDLVRVKLGEAPDLVEVPESGEYEYGSFGEKGERYAVKTYGRIISFTRQLMVNDDLSGLTRFPRAFGASAARKRNSLAWGLITGNQTMSDGVALFHANHGNLGTDALGETGLTNMQVKMMKQTGIDGKLIVVNAAYIVVPVELKVTGQKLLSAIQATTTGDVNVYANAYQLITEPLLSLDSTTAWYAFASPGEHDVFEHASLSGVGEEPVFESEFGFDVDGVKLKARMDFGIRVLDHVGAYKSTP